MGMMKFTRLTLYPVLALLQGEAHRTSQVLQTIFTEYEKGMVRYDAAAKARVLQKDTLDADRRKYELGAINAYQVVQDQRDLANTESAEVQAMANFTHARIAFDQALGITLDVNNISLDEALTGQVGGKAGKERP